RRAPGCARTGAALLEAHAGRASHPWPALLPAGGAGLRRASRRWLRSGREAVRLQHCPPALRCASDEPGDRARSLDLLAGQLEVDVLERRPRDDETFELAALPQGLLGQLVQDARRAVGLQDDLAPVLAVADL